jgi:Deoxynucleoside kinase/Transposase
VPTHHNIAFEGPIAAGKTTHATLLAGKIGSKLPLEDSLGNEFLADFYSDNACWSLPMQLSFLALRYDQLSLVVAPLRKQKTDRQDAQLILQLMLEDRFPKIWVPSWENRDLRQLLWHRYRMVQARTRIMNQLRAVALNEGLRCRKQLARGWTRATGVVRVSPWASRRRRDLLELLDRLTPTIAELTQTI